METQKKYDKHSPIGVFDSGLGGLTAVKEIIEQLPHEDIVFFGDTARVPYGNRSRETIIEYSRQDMRFLLAHDVKIVCIACNTVDSMARLTLEQEFDIPIIGAVSPAARKALQLTKNKKIGLIGTFATVSSGAYRKLINKLAPDCTVYSQACPLLVPLIESGRFHKGDAVVETVLRDYLLPLQAQGIDTIILGCTHYPLLYAIVKDILPGVEIVCSGSASTEYLREKLAALDLLNDSETEGKRRFYVSDAPEEFATHGSVFLGMSVREHCEKADPDIYQ